MTRRSLIRAWTTALLLAQSLACAQTSLDWNADAFPAMEDRLAQIPAPPAPPAQPAGPADPDARARALFRKPLIIGASVSSGYRAESPAHRLARRFGSADAVVSLADQGASGARMVQELTDERLAAATVVVGVDLFFWDAQRDCNAGLAAVDGLFRRLEPRRTPVVLGNVPPIRGGSCGRRLNEKIENACANDSSCVLLDLNRLYENIVADGGAEIDGRRYTLRSLQPDGYHLSDAGSELVSRAILDAVAKSAK